MAKTAYPDPRLIHDMSLALAAGGGSHKSGVSGRKWRRAPCHRCRESGHGRDILRVAQSRLSQVRQSIECRHSQRLLLRRFPACRPGSPGWAAPSLSRHSNTTSTGIESLRASPSVMRHASMVWKSREIGKQRDLVHVIQIQTEGCQQMSKPEKKVEPERPAEVEPFEHVTAEDFATGECEAPIAAAARSMCSVTAHFMRRRRRKPKLPAMERSRGSTACCQRSPRSTSSRTTKRSRTARCSLWRGGAA